jgi:hypothetical protein
MLIEGMISRSAGMIRYGSHILYEKASGYHPTNPNEVPASAARISPKWLEAVICDGTPGAKVLNVEIVGGSDGTNTRRALEVTYNDVGLAADLPRELFAKSATSIRTRIMNGRTTRGESEVRFYQSFRDRLNIEAPRAIYARFDRASGRMFILFPNMTVQGTKFLNPMHHVTREQAEGMIDLLATYQSAFWNHPELTTKSWLLSTYDYQRLINVHAIPFEHCGAVGLQRAASVLPSELLAVGRKRLWRLHMGSIERLERRPHTLTHYDMHVGNWYITADQRMGLTDWSMRFGHWSADLTYMLLSALEIEDRRSWERDLLVRYRERLRQHSVPEVPSTEEIWDEYRRQAFHPLYFWLTTIGAGVLQPDMQPDSISLINLKRMGQALVDLDSVRMIEQVL